VSFFGGARLHVESEFSEEMSELMNA
jgi:hypothetical protein